MNYENFSKNIKWLRGHYGLSQDKLAKEIDVNRPVIAQWEAGKNGATLEAAEKIRKKYSLSLDDLYFADLSEINDQYQANEPGSVYKLTESCKNCSEKEKIIQSQRETIVALQDNVRTLNELLDSYRNKSNTGEKRAS